MKWPVNIWHRLQSLGFAVCAGLVALGVALMFLPLLQQRRSLLDEARRLDQELARQEAVERQQITEIQALRTDPTFVESTARDKLNLVRPGETIFRFEPAPAAARPQR